MTEIAVLGDTHGQTSDTIKVVRRIARHGVKRIVQVGDFGLWDHFDSGVTFLDSLNEELRRHGIKMYAIGGNHENWNRWNWYVENNDKDAFDFTILRTHIRIAPKVFSWKWDGKAFGAAGGGVSTDRDWRINKEKESGLGPYNLYWPGEQLTDEEANNFPTAKLDYLFTHDCSNRTPFKNRLKPDFESQMHRKRIDTVLARSKPKMHFHGHMHEKYEWMNFVGPDHWVDTYGLERDGMFWNWGILDLATDKFVFAPVLMK